MEEHRIKLMVSNQFSINSGHISFYELTLSFFSELPAMDLRMETPGCWLGQLLCLLDAGVISKKRRSVFRNQTTTISRITYRVISKTYRAISMQGLLINTLLLFQKM
jgi:hypothetical protein